VVREGGFSRIHVFSYSPRKGTPAAMMTETVPAPIVAQRRERLLRLESELAQAFYRRLLGRRLDVLVEGADSERPGYVRGTSCRYAPVAFEGYAPALLGRRLTVRAADVDSGVILGVPEPESDPQNGNVPSSMPSMLSNSRRINLAVLTTVVD
jgi:threonylcarbamoyladenosine tRNA methylthiotransferase MtaB